MSVRKWLAVFAVAVLLCACCAAAFNVLTDPFGVFGDRLMDWYAYDMTMNPRVAKIGYLDKNYEKYDSYVIGSSKCSSLSPEKLNEYMDASFYNMTWYGGDLTDELALARYIVENYRVKNIVLAVDPQDAELFDTESDPMKGNMHCKVDGSFAPAFYAKYLFANPEYGFEKLRAYAARGLLVTPDAVYKPENGAYNKSVRDSTRIGALGEYLAFENNYYAQAPSSMPHLDGALDAIARIVEICRDNGVELTVVGVPLYTGDLARYDREKMEEFWRGVAEITPFYDFWGANSVTGDIRYFYDVEHFRNCVGDMVLGYIFSDPTVWMPEDFGSFTTPENVEARMARTYAALEEPAESNAAAVPILMYHSFTDTRDDSNQVTGEELVSHLTALRDAGFTAITYDDLFDYVYSGGELPERPVLITFDDGYKDNLDIAAPILERYGMSAAISVIGVSVGKDTYKETGVPMTPHFALEDAAPWVEKGVLEIKSHSYDMHQVPERDGADCRQGVLRMDGESESDYVAALTADFQRSSEQITAALPVKSDVFTYPNGLYDRLSEVTLQGMGVRATVTTDYGVNMVLRGIPQTLFALKRVGVDPGLSGAELLERLETLLADPALN